VPQKQRIADLCPGKVVRLKGATVDYADYQGRTPLHEARHGHVFRIRSFFIPHTFSFSLCQGVRKVHRGHDLLTKFHEYRRGGDGPDGHCAGSLLWSPKPGGVPFGQSRGTQRGKPGLPGLGTWYQTVPIVLPSFTALNTFGHVSFSSLWCLTHV
jgi:hypothetical protein